MVYRRDYYERNKFKYKKGGAYYYYIPKTPPFELKKINKKIIIYFD